MIEKVKRGREGKRRRGKGKERKKHRTESGQYIEMWWLFQWKHITVCSYADGREERMYDAQNWK